MDQHIEVDKKKALNAVLGVQVAFILAFFISACVVAKNSNEGFNVVITAILYVGYVVYALYVVNKKKGIDATGVEGAVTMRPMVGGILIGMNTMFIFLSLMTAVYWGQFANCETGYNNVAGYSCYKRSGMRSVCAFASLLFICQFAMLLALIKWKDDLFESDPGYDNFGDSGDAAYNYDAPPAAGTQAADL